MSCVKLIVRLRLHITIQKKIASEVCARTCSQQHVNVCAYTRIISVNKIKGTTRNNIMPKKMLDKRSFKVSMSSFGVSGGRYISSTPSSAAKKAARILFRQSDTGSVPSGGKPMNVSFELRETTRGSKDTVFAYRAVREKRTTPTNFIANGKPFSIKRTYNITVTAVTEQTMMRNVTRKSNKRSGESRSPSPTPGPSPFTPLAEAF